MENLVEKVNRMKEKLKYVPKEDLIIWISGFLDTHKESVLDSSANEEFRKMNVYCIDVIDGFVNKCLHFWVIRESANPEEAAERAERTKDKLKQLSKEDLIELVGLRFELYREWALDPEVDKETREFSKWLIDGFDSFINEFCLH